jgi:cell wall-associated NlpC family hydrolase
MLRRCHIRSALLIVATPASLLIAAPVNAATIAGHNPIGHLDSVKVTAQQLTFAGWAGDPDTTAAVRVIAAVDGVDRTTVTASSARTDVAKVYPALGPNRGFGGTLSMTAGTHVLCATAVNVGSGVDTGLGCLRFTVAPPPPTRPPFGNLEAISYGAGAVKVSGWSIDPDTSGPTRVAATVNGSVVGFLTANLSRPDVARVYPVYGANHGFVGSVTKNLAPGNYQLCAIGVNTSSGANTLFGCRIVTVLPVTEPSELGTATATAAAKEIQAQAIASGAAKAADFPTAATAAARIAIASRALLQQAAGRRAAPPVKTGIPKFAASTTTKVVDVQAVMGKTPALGSYPAAKTGGRAGANRSLEVYRNDPLTLYGSAGDGIIGAAPVLPTNGKTVRPVLPGYPAGYTRTRAEVALDNALAQLGAPYVWAASGASTFDCSGLTQWAWGKAGVNLYHYTGSQAVQGVRVQPNQVLPGDLVLYGSDLHHVGMYVGAGYMIDAPYTGSYVRLNKIAWYGDFTLAVRP